MPKKKKSHVQDSIYVVRQFVYVHRVARISLLLGKNIQSAAVQFFFSLKNYNHETLITKTLVSISYAQDSQQATKRLQNTKCCSTVFFLFKKLQPQNPNHQNSGFYILRIGFTAVSIWLESIGLNLCSMDYKPQKISHLKPCNIILGQGGSSTR